MPRQNGKGLGNSILQIGHDLTHHRAPEAETTDPSTRLRCERQHRLDIATITRMIDTNIRRSKYCRSVSQFHIVMITQAYHTGDMQPLEGSPIDRSGRRR